MAETHIESVYASTALELGTSGLPTEYHVVPGFLGFADATNGAPVDVHCLDALLGRSYRRPGYSAHALVHGFVPSHPSLALVSVVDLRDHDHCPSPEPARFGLSIERRFSSIFLPTMFSALNGLDPAGQGRGLLVQSYHAEVTLVDFLQACFYTAKLMYSFRTSGQLAIIAVDYSDPYTTWMADVSMRLPRRFTRNIHLLPRTREPSNLGVPVRGRSGSTHVLTNNSTALDAGLALAIEYLDGRRSVNAGDR